jgi:hypothetical protein
MQEEIRNLPLLSYSIYTALISHGMEVGTMKSHFLTVLFGCQKLTAATMFVSQVMVVGGEAGNTSHGMGNRHE